ncbi:MAG: YidC/Oxa1 family membrane protein insertase [Clostridia bacterium]
MEFISSIFSGVWSVIQTLPQNDWTKFIPEPNAVARLMQWFHGLIGNYGVAIIILTVILKIITMPLDIWQKYSMKKSSVKMKSLEKTIEKIDKQFANDKKRQNEEKQKLYKKNGYNALSSCLPMLATMAIFIIVFSGLNSYSAFINVNSYVILEKAYIEEYNKYLIDSPTGEWAVGMTEDQIKAYAKEKADVKVNVVFKDEVQEDFLWIKNIWRPDTWEKLLVNAEGFEKGSMGIPKLPDEAIGDPFVRDIYVSVRNAVIKANPGYFASFDEQGNMEKNSSGELKSGWNGLLILPIAAMGLAFLSSWVTQALQKKKGTTSVDPSAQTGKTMMIIMPLMMGVFGFMYTAAFAIYLVCNSLITLITTIALDRPIEIMVERKAVKKGEGVKESYKR